MRISMSLAAFEVASESFLESECNVTTLDTYDSIGRLYSMLRRPDPRLVARLDALIGCNVTILNVGQERVHTNPLEAELSLPSPRL